MKPRWGRILETEALHFRTSSSKSLDSKIAHKQRKRPASSHLLCTMAVLCDSKRSACHYPRSIALPARQVPAYLERSFHFLHSHLDRVEECDHCLSGEGLVGGADLNNTLTLKTPTHVENQTLVVRSCKKIEEMYVLVAMRQSSTAVGKRGSGGFESSTRT